MYINEVVRICDSLYPNPFDRHEKYHWCDELSSTIRMVYDPVYVKCCPERGQDGGYLLPEGVQFSMISRILRGNRELKKEDFRGFGIYTAATEHGERIYSVPEGSGELTVIYKKPHENIRDIEYLDRAAEFGDGYVILEKCEFRRGDILTIRVGEQTVSDVAVLDVFPEDKEMVRVILSPTGFSGRLTADFRRDVTEQTVCEAPYDSMYIDYVLGNICYYQRDMSGYEAHMERFHQKMKEYAYWLKQNNQKEQGRRICNWW